MTLLHMMVGTLPLFHQEPRLGLLRTTCRPISLPPFAFEAIGLTSGAKVFTLPIVCRITKCEPGNTTGGTIDAPISGMVNSVTRPFCNIRREAITDAAARMDFRVMSPTAGATTSRLQSSFEQPGRSVCAFLEACMRGHCYQLSTPCTCASAFSAVKSRTVG